MSMGLGATLGKGGGVLLPPPAGFSYDFGDYPLTITRFGSVHRTNFNAEALASTALNGVPYYVDPATGSDANNGLSVGARKASASSAFTAGNTAGVPFHVIYRDTGVIRPRANSINAVAPTQPCAIIADGSVAFGTHDLLTYTSVGGGGYTAPRTNVARVVYLDDTDSFGNPLELVKQANRAAWDAADPGATGVWVQDGASVCVKLPGGVVPTNSNTLALLITSNVTLPSASSKDFLLDGIDLYGGSTGCFFANAVTGNIILRNSRGLFSGGSGQLLDAFRVVDITGLAAFDRCEAYAAAKDAFNGSQTVAAQMQMLTIDCVARDNGRFTSQSNNGLTLHGTMQGIDVGGDYTDNYGGNVHIIDASELWAVGTQARRSKGDVVLGGSINPCEFITNGTAQMWREDTIADPTVPNAAGLATDTSFIRSRNHTDVSGGNFGAGTFEAF